MTPEDLADRLERRLAFYFSHNNQPCMSGDPRDRCSPLQRRNLSEAVASVIEEMQALSSALAPQAGDNAEEPVTVPDGWKLVPKVPTHEMELAGIDTGLIGKAIQEGFAHWQIYYPSAIYKAMIAASPTSTSVVSQNAPALEDKGGDGWQPMQTAPRDGTVIILCGGAYGGYPFSGKWELGPFANTDRPWLNVITGSRLYEHAMQMWMPVPPSDPAPGEA
jgi:hypothetical protein